MQAIILAAGKSERFYPFRSFGHKSMVPVMGKPLLQHTLEALRRASFSSAIIVVAKDSIIPEKLQKVNGLSVTYITQEETLGMGHALLQAKDSLEDSFFLLSGYHVDIADFAKEMKEKQKNSQDVVLLAKEDVILEKYGVLEVDGDRVVSITEKPENISGKAFRAVAVYLLTQSFLSILNEIPLEHYHFEKALDAYAKKGNVSYVVASSPAVTLKHSWDLLDVKDYLLSNMRRSISRNASIAKSVIIDREVVVSDGVKIFEGACVKGPCFLGRNVIVGNNAILRGGVIAEEDAVIGANMEVKNSLLMKEATTHTGYIGDSVIGQKTRLAAGFCSANVRFDRADVIAEVNGKKVNTHRSHIGVVMGEKVDVGINVSTMPGICIGNNVTIGPSTVVLENIDDDYLVYSKFEAVKKKKHE